LEAKLKNRVPKNKQTFEEELRELRRILLEMGVVAQEMISDAVAALVRQSTTQAEAVILRDEIVDRTNHEVETLCLRLLTRRAASDADLRFIVSTLKVVADVERIADHAVDIARVTVRMSSEAIYKPLVDVPQLAGHAQEMLHQAIVAFVRRDTGPVEAIITADDTTDALYSHMRSELVAVLQRDPHVVVQATYLLFVVHYLERIGDHCTNIAERVSARSGTVKA
jgi:phosphate transport system protein